MRLRDTRHTGPNRCWPCTILNGVVLALAVGGLVAVGHRLLAAALLLGGTVALLLKGYLVPGTPSVGRRLPRTVRERFGKTDPISSRPATTALVEAGVLTNGLTLRDDAAEEILGESRTLVDGRSRLEAAVETRFPTVEEVSVNRSLGGGENWFALDADEMTIRQWPARPVVALDVAAASVLQRAGIDWAGRSPTERGHLLALVRYGTQTCPACEMPFTTPNGPTVSCCGGRSLAGERRCVPCGYALVDRNDLPPDETNGKPDGDAATLSKPGVDA